MFSPQKIATVSGLVGSLAIICLGGAHAYAEGKPDDCKTSEQGTVCVHKSETYTDQDGTHVIKQTQDCSTTDRPSVVDPENGLVGGGSTHVGPVVDCSNKAELPKGFKKPQIAS
ncbi:hypothetical protein ACF1BE_03885 [Streptomyces sp. NPDC014991]|uniref:hypothetical protein n=1 Tax=Streptomyces sp. NPDC014991 TaxID=3364935 RepID=UPI0037004201